MEKPFFPQEGELVIAADGGLADLKRFGIEPDLIVGDFDSLNEKPTGGNVLTYPVEKDDTDMMLAVKLGLEKGCTLFYLYGGMGGRTDHTLANIQTLCYLAERGCRGYLVGESETVTVIQDGSLRFASCGSGTLSVFALSKEVCGVYERGVKYEVENARLTYDFPLGVSNAFVKECAEIGVEKGTLAVLWEHRDGKNAVVSGREA